MRRQRQSALVCLYNVPPGWIYMWLALFILSSSEPFALKGKGESASGECLCFRSCRFSLKQLCLVNTRVCLWPSITTSTTVCSIGGVFSFRLCRWKLEHASFLNQKRGLHEVDTNLQLLLLWRWRYPGGTHFYWVATTFSLVMEVEQRLFLLSGTFRWEKATCI